VTVVASTVIDGVTYTDTKEIEFGPGPLSVFTGVPQQSARWASQNGNAGSGTNMTDASTTFPAAAVCGGTVYNHTPSEIEILGSGPYTVDFKHVSWGPGEYWTDERYSTTSRLPRLSQLSAVSKHNGTNYAYAGLSSDYRKGAAMAAGWPDDQSGTNYYRYWSGQVGFDTSNGSFFADGVNLSSGSDWSYSLANTNPVVACVGP
jgi:hypothetical protein